MPTRQFMGNSFDGIQHVAKEINMNYAKSWPVILLMMYISLKCRINGIECAVYVCSVWVKENSTAARLCAHQVDLLSLNIFIFLKFAMSIGQSIWILNFGEFTIIVGIWLQLFNCFCVKTFHGISTYWHNTMFWHSRVTSNVKENVKSSRCLFSRMPRGSTMFSVPSLGFLGKQFSLRFDWWKFRAKFTESKRKPIEIWA